MPLAWADREALAAALQARFPRRDPLTVRLPDLVRWVTEIPGFAGGARPGWAEIEAIQAAWYDAYRERPGSPAAPIAPGPATK